MLSAIESTRTAEGFCEEVLPIALSAHIIKQILVVGIWPLFVNVVIMELQICEHPASISPFWKPPLFYL